ncbi:MAG: NifB/NifX family molybdenum-iron cluster-binding protein [Candidatus Hodarchaeales archaeon]
MRICIPSETKGGLKDQLGYHFGRVPTYTIFDDEKNDVEIINNTSTHMGGEKYPAEILHDYKVDVMICGGIGRRAIQLFEQFGIEVYAGAQGTIKDAIDQYKNQKLQMATDKDACQEHKFHDSEHSQNHNH